MPQLKTAVSFDLEGLGKGTVFFYFPGKVCRLLTHSILSNFVFFFFQPLGKKKNICFFFFPRKSLEATHSPQKQMTPKIGQKR